LSDMDGEAGFPRLLYHGRQEVILDGAPRPCEVLVMQLLGPSLEDVMWQTAGGTMLPSGCVVRIAEEALELLQRLHHHGWLHNDVTPSNLCVEPSHEGRLHLVDFGSATRLSSSSDLHPPGVGTPLFSSLAAIRGERRMPSDDIESLCYALVYLGAGSLPWGRQSTAEATADAKATLRERPGAFEEWVEPLETSVAAVLSTLWHEGVLRGNQEPTADMYSCSYDSEWPARCRGALRDAAASTSSDPDARSDARMPWPWSSARANLRK
jgi:serine/threonine protein kinase